MAGSRVLLETIVFTLLLESLCTIKVSSASRLNVPRVLLPVLSDFPVNFTLEVTEGGCYQWSTSRLDVVHLIPMSENAERTCSSAVMVQSVTREPTRNTAIVLAEDINTGQFLRCDVIVDAIFSLNLVTTTRELFIEEAPEAFEVRAYDEQGNEFTTLAGVEFQWNIGGSDKRQNENEYNNILRFMTFQESPYETPPTIAMLDGTNKMGHIILLEGIKTGTTKVSVRLPYVEYKHVPAVEVELIVVANLIILPTDVTMMAYDSFKYRIMQVQQGRLEEISLPSSQYYLEAENPAILEINNDRRSAYSLARGRTKVLLHDRNVHEEYGVVLPTATVNINEVAYITITVMPNRNSGLILGETHEIVVDLFDSKDHKFHIGEGVEVSVDIDPQFFETKSMTQNGTHVVVVPIACGTTIAEACLHGVIDKQGKKIPLVPSLVAKAELVIHTPVLVSPRVLAVPWDSKSKSRFDIALKATGGDGKYVWSSRQPSIVSISQNGVVRVLSEGTADVTVSMTRNQYNRDRARVHVLLPSRLEIIQYKLEAAVGDAINLHVALFGRLGEGADAREVPFNDCREIPFEVYIPEGIFVQNASGLGEQPVGIACATVRVVGTGVGTSGVTVAYSANGQYLLDNVTISAYERLVAVHPATAETLLALGSSRKIVFRGGPHPWAGKPQGYARRITVSGPEGVVRVADQRYADAPDVSVHEVSCASLGDVFVTYAVSNTPVLPNCRSSEASASVRVICGKPRSIELQPEFRDSENCPIGRDGQRVMAHSDRPLRLVISVKDEDGRRFDNVSSLSIDWTLKPSDSGLAQVAVGTQEETFTDLNVVLPRSHYQIIVPKKHTGSLAVIARVSGYQKDVLSRSKITPEWPPFAVMNERGSPVTPLIEAEVSVFLVNDTTINPSRMKVLNDPAGKYSLQVSQGSGYYEFVLSSEEVADIRYVEPTKTISVIAKRPGVLRIALVDLCIASTPAEAEIEVQQLAGIEIESVNKVEKGKCIVATLKLYDTNGHAMELPHLEALEINVEIDENLVEIKKLPANEQGEAPYAKLLYVVHGLEEGEAHVVFTSGYGDQEIRSETATVQVFRPLRVTERNLTVLVGTVCQIGTSGGPTNAESEFLVENEGVLTIDARGVLEGRAVGHANVTARAVGLNAKGNRVIYSQDHVHVRVTHLQGVKIVVPTARVKVGAVVPLWAFGIPENLTPLIIGSMKSLLSFTWLSSDPSMLSLHNMYEGTGINIRYQNEVTLRAKALKPGLATVYLNVTTPAMVLAGYKDDASFSTFAKIEIFEELAVSNPEVTPGISVLLMEPNSALRLKTNRDKHGVSSYRIVANGHGNESEDPNALTPAAKTVTVDKTGLVKSGENYGRTIISVTNVEAYNLKQSVSVIVDVKPIHYMMLALSSNIRIRSGEELNMLPKGMELNYVVEYFDSVGNKFHALKSRFKTAVNRADLVSFAVGSENAIAVKFNEDGELVAKIHSEKYPNVIFDYVHMMIGDIIFPTKTTLTVGDIVCFSMPLLASETGDPGSWQSSSPEILSVDSITGIGRAKNPGHTVVKHSLTTHKQGEIEVSVQPIAKISLVVLRGKNFTGTEVFSVPLVLKSKDEGIKENNVLARGLGGCRTYSSFSLGHFPFACNIQFVSPLPSVNIKDVFLTKPRFDIVTGFYYCDIIPLGAPTIVTSTLETRVLVNAQSRDVEGTPLEIAYLPPIYVSTKEILFVQTSAQPTATLEVYGLPLVLEQVTVDVPEGAVIISRQFVTKHSAHYKLRLMQNHEDIQGQRVTVLNELTRQNVSLLIRISKHESYAPISGIHWLDYVYFHRYTFGTFAVLVFTFLYLWKNKVASVNLSVGNSNVFADRCPPPMKKSPTLNSTTLNSSLNSSSPRASGSPSPLRPFSAFEPVYGDPRGIYTPNARRNYSFQSP